MQGRFLEQPTVDKKQQETKVLFSGIKFAASVGETDLIILGVTKWPPQ